jgi:hypothetical protein
MSPVRDSSYDLAMDVPPEVTTAVVKVATDAAQAAADSANGRAVLANLTEPFVIASRAVRNIFLPLALFNAKRERYFEGEFVKELGEKIETIPEEHRRDPKPSVVAPAIEGLGNSFEESELRNLYLNLLAASVDGRRADVVHPGFGEIIKQLTTDEVGALNAVLAGQNNQEVARIRSIVQGENSGLTVYSNLLNLTANGAPYVNPGLSSYVDNWERLGLLRVDYSRRVASENAYAWVEVRPEYMQLVEAHAGTDRYISHEDGALILTDFGRKFASVVRPAEDSV